MIVFLFKNGQFVNTNENERWILTDKIDLEKSEYYIYEFINEIMDDLKCRYEDITVLENISGWSAHWGPRCSGNPAKNN